MRQSRFSEAQIIGMIKEQEAGMPTAEVCRRHGLSPASFYKFKAKYGGMNVSDTHRLKSLEDENATQAAVALAEERQPDRRRIICSATTNDLRRGDRPTRWSAAIDEIAAGVDAAEGEEPPRRLFVQSIGNIGHDDDWSNIADVTLHSGEDPAQAWNALTIGGLTLKNAIEIHDQGIWFPCADVGELSPYSRTSCDWPNSTTPVKPELVFEAGNRAVIGLPITLIDEFVGNAQVNTDLEPPLPQPSAERLSLVETAASLNKC